MELYIATDKDKNIHITDNHESLPDSPVRSWIMNFPGKQNRIILNFDSIDLVDDAFTKETIYDGCDHCGRARELYHNENTGLALCESCDQDAK